MEVHQFDIGNIESLLLYSIIKSIISVMMRNMKFIRTQII